MNTHVEGLYHASLHIPVGPASNSGIADGTIRFKKRAPYRVQTDKTYSAELILPSHFGTLIKPRRGSRSQVEIAKAAFMTQASLRDAENGTFSLRFVHAYHVYKTLGDGVLTLVFSEANPASTTTPQAVLTVSPKDYQVIVGEYFQELREEKDMPQEEAANVLGVAQSRISTFESGVRSNKANYPRTATIAKYFSLFGKHVSYVGMRTH